MSAASSPSPGAGRTSPNKARPTPVSCPSCGERITRAAVRKGQCGSCGSPVCPLCSGDPWECEHLLAVESYLESYTWQRSPFSGDWVDEPEGLMPPDWDPRRVTAANKRQAFGEASTLVVAYERDWMLDAPDEHASDEELDDDPCQSRMLTRAEHNLWDALARTLHSRIRTVRYTNIEGASEVMYRLDFAEDPVAVDQRIKVLIARMRDGARQLGYTRN